MKTNGNAPKQAGQKKNPKIQFPLIMDKLQHVITDRLSMIDKKRLLMMNVPYMIVFYLADKLSWLYRHCIGSSFGQKAGVLFLNFQLAFETPIPSFHTYDLAVGVIGAAVVKALVYMKGKNAKKYRQGVEYGSARWGA